MSFEELKTFICLAKVRSFSKAAQIMYISQSAVSTRIKNIESELGVQLLIRDSKGLELTPAGQDFFNHAITINQMMDDSIQNLKRVGKYKYQITISAPESHWSYAILPALEHYLKKNADIAFNLCCNHSWVVNQQVLNNNADIGISCEYIKHPSLEYHFLYDYSYVLVCHPELELPGKQLTPQNISAWPFIYFNWGEEFSEWLNHHYLFGMHFLEIENISMFLYLLLHKTGLGFLPERIAKPHIKDGTLKVVEYLYSDTAPHDVAYIIHPRKKKDLVQPIVDKILSYAKEHFESETQRNEET